MVYGTGMQTLLILALHGDKYWASRSDSFFLGKYLTVPYGGQVGLRAGLDVGPLPRSKLNSGPLDVAYLYSYIEYIIKASSLSWWSR
jgi:hypothetical protein